MTLPLVARKSVLMIASLAVPAMLLAQDYPPDLSRGKAVYERHCLSCHGTSGRGDGPAAASLRVAPANFQRFGSFLKSDEELHSWRGELTDEEMSDVLAYVRFLSQQAR
jgi:mono/diheme cytochrome c family protein